MFTIEFLRREGSAICVVAAMPSESLSEGMSRAEELIESGHFGPMVAQGFRLLDDQGEVVVTSWILPGEYHA